MDGDEDRLSVEHLVTIVGGNDNRPGVADQVDVLQAQTAREASDEVNQGQKSILIVDEKYLTDTLMIIFQIIGFQVDTAHNGLQALKKTLDKSYDLVIMEANLSDTRGFEIAQIIKNMCRKTKIVLMTGDEYWEETIRGAPMEVDDVLLKPFFPEELVNTVHRILELQVKSEKGKTPELLFALPSF
jgi:DNA-binding response OmpR family regulator